MAKLYIILMFIVSLSMETTGLIDYLMGYKHPQYDHCELSFITFALIMASIVQSILQNVRCNISILGILALIGMILGQCSHYFKWLLDYTKIAEISPYQILALCAPGVIFYSAFNVDIHTFSRSWSQILITSTFGLALNTFAIGFATKLIVGGNWNYSQMLIFGILVAPVHPQSIVGLIKDVGCQAKHAIGLLEGESMITITLSLIFFRILDEYDQGIETEPQSIITKIFWNIILGFTIGIIIGKLTRMLICCRHNSLTSVILLTLVSPYVTFYICEEFVKCSGLAAVFCIGLTSCLERQNFTAELDRVVSNFWELLVNAIFTWVSLMVGVNLTRKTTYFLYLSDIPPMLVTYLIANVSRFLTLLILSPVLSCISYGFTMNKLVLISWGTIRSHMCAIMSWIGLQSGYGKFGIELVTNLNGCFVLTLWINVLTLPIVLNCLNMGQLSSFRKSNMNNCFKQVLESRERTIAMLKMDRFLSDANWPLVQQYTIIKHPYSHLTKLGEDEHDISSFGYHQTTCPECFQEVISEPTKKELKDIKKEAGLRMLKAMKISYMKQHEKGLLSKDGLRVLSTTIESASERKEPMVDLQIIYKFFTKQDFMYYIRKYVLEIYIYNDKKEILRPRRPFRQFCYDVVTHIGFDLFIIFTILLNMIPISIELKVSFDSHSIENIVIVIFNALFFSIYLIECVMKIAAYSRIHVIPDGFKTYFKSLWNTFDFVILLIAFLDLMVDIVDLSTTVFNKTDSNFATSTVALKTLRVIRLCRLFKLCKDWYPQLVKYVDLKIDMNLAFAYEIGKGFVQGEEEVLDLLPQIVDNNEIREELREMMESDKLAITREIGLVQKNRPWIAITVKTRQAMRSTLSSMLEGITELKTSGWIDEYEHQKLIDCLNERVRHIQNIKSVPSCSPKVIFSEVSWMGGDKRVSEFLYENVHSKLYDVGDYVCAEGVSSNGIFIVVSGLLKLTYVPREESLEFQAEHGCLPVVDYIAISKLLDKAEEYIISGNTIGELCTLTDRPYDCDIIAETQSQVYILPRDVILKAFEINEDPIFGLEARLWRSVSIRTGMSVLMDVPAYQSMPHKEIQIILDRAFVPNLNHFKIFTVNDMIEDIILIEGVVIDYNSHECFFGPSYIHRTVQRLILSKSSLMTIVTNVQVKLLIIPTKDVSEYDLMTTAEDISVLDPDQRRIYAHMNTKPSRRKWKKGGAAFTDSTSKSSFVPGDESEINNYTMDNQSSSVKSVSKKGKTSSHSSQLGKI